MSGAAPVERRGRRRRFDETTERTMLLDAAVEVMGRSGYAETSVADVLAESGLSTRSFYRHFESKDALLDALVRREVASVVRHVERAVSEAGGVGAYGLEAGVVAWVDALLDTFFDPERASRGALFSSPNVVASSPIADELETFRSALCRPLADLLGDAVGRGDVDSPDPAADAATVFAVVADTARRAAVGAGRGAVRDQILRFVRPVLLTSS